MRVTFRNVVMLQDDFENLRYKMQLYLIKIEKYYMQDEEIKLISQVFRKECIESPLKMFTSIIPRKITSSKTRTNQ